MGRKKDLLRFVPLHGFSLIGEVMIYFETIINEFSSYKKTRMHEADKDQFQVLRSLLISKTLRHLHFTTVVNMLTIY